MSGGGAADGVKDGQAVVVSGRIGLGGYVYGGLGGGTKRGGGGDRQDGDDDGINRWEDTVSNVILGTEHNDPLASAPVLELHHQIMSMLGGHRGWLERERELVEGLSWTYFGKCHIVNTGYKEHINITHVCRSTSLYNPQGVTLLPLLMRLLLLPELCIIMGKMLEFLMAATIHNQAWSQNLEMAQYIMAGPLA